jgi:hypothetical protein
VAAHQSSHHGRRSWGNQPFAYGFVRVWLVAEMVGLLVVGFCQIVGKFLQGGVRRRGTPRQ